MFGGASDLTGECFGSFPLDRGTFVPEGSQIPWPKFKKGSSESDGPSPYMPEMSTEVSAASVACRASGPSRSSCSEMLELLQGTVQLQLKELEQKQVQLQMRAQMTEQIQHAQVMQVLQSQCQYHNQMGGLASPAIDGMSYACMDGGCGAGCSGSYGVGFAGCAGYNAGCVGHDASYRGYGHGQQHPQQQQYGLQQYGPHEWETSAMMQGTQPSLWQNRSRAAKQHLPRKRGKARDESDYVYIKLPQAALATTQAQ